MLMEARLCDCKLQSELQVVPKDSRTYRHDRYQLRLWLSVCGQSDSRVESALHCGHESEGTVDAPSHSKRQTHQIRSETQLSGSKQRS